LIRTSAIRHHASTNWSRSPKEETIVPYGPNTTFAQLRDDPEALAVLEHYLPGILDEPDLRLQPYTVLEDLSLRVHAVGEPFPDLTAMWQALAVLGSAGPPPELPPPAPPADRYHGDTRPAGSARMRVPEHAEKWGLAELELDGPDRGNPFVEVELSVTFRQGDNAVRVGGFYDGSGIYRIRFMPPAEGSWSFETTSNAQSLDGITGTLTVAAPKSENHGRVVVRDAYHFRYQDGTAYLPFGTTAYAWTHQPDALQEHTLDTLKAAAFTKLRMCVFPKSFVYNSREPDLFPFERAQDGSWDFTRFSEPYFQVLERRIIQLQQLGVEADLILFHPYDRWGFSQMPRWADQLYTAYVVRRLAALRNVWWSLANEYDFMRSKTVDDWEGIAEVITREDHAGHLTSIHNGFVLYDHIRPWVTHCSIQKNDTQNTAANVDEWRGRFGKPVVVDEIGYEGNLPWGWGNLTAEELVRRAWEGAVRGGYVNHGETYHDDNKVVWWSHGGALRGESPQRFRFLARIVAEAPTGRFEPLPSDLDVQYGGDRDHRVAYFGTARPISRQFKLPPGTWDIDVIDTWAMTVTTLPQPAHGAVELALPGRQYMAVRFRRHN
jgi:hypothetical protein